MAHYAISQEIPHINQEKNNSWKYQTNSTGSKCAFLEITIRKEKLRKFEISDPLLQENYVFHSKKEKNECSCSAHENSYF